MTPAVNTGENYTGLSATQTDDVEEQYDDIIAVAAKNGQVQPASNEDSYKGSTVGQLATALRAEILRARRMRLFVLTVIIVTFVKVQPLRSRKQKHQVSGITSCFLMVLLA